MKKTLLLAAAIPMKLGILLCSILLAAAPLFSAIDTRGFEATVLAGADSIFQKKYRLFEAALKKGNLLPPIEGPAAPNAYDLYQELAALPQFESLRGEMLHNLAAALQEESQQAINAYLRADEAEAAARSRGDLRYTKYVRYLDKAAELLGPDHYLYKSLRAKQYYFNAVDIRVRFHERTFSLGDSSVVWKKAREESIQKAHELMPNAAFILNEMYLTFKGPERLDYLNKAIEIAPEWSIPYGNLAVVALRKDDFAKADSFAKKAIALAPGYAHHHILLGWSCSGQKKLAEAEGHFERAAALSPDNVNAKKALADFYLDQKRYPEAEKTWLDALALSPNDNDLHNSLSNFYNEKTQDYEKAIAFNLQRLKMRPTDGDAYSDLLDAYRGARQFDKIPALVEDMKQLDASIENWEGTTVLGDGLVYLGQTEAGLAVEKRAIRAAPENPWSYYGIAYTYRKMGDLETFLAYIDTAFSKNIHRPNVERYSNVPSAVGSPSYPAFAQKWMDKYPKWGFGQSLMGVYFDEKKDWATALEFHKKAVALSPDSEFNWFYYACSAHKSGQEKTADAFFQKYLGLTQDFAQHYLRIANFYVQNGAFKKATFFYKKAIGKDPSTTTAYYNLACIESLQNRPKKAFKLLETALKNGFANYDWLQKDPDFDRLRARREWPVLIKKYFPEKVRA